MKLFPVVFLSGLASTMAVDLGLAAQEFFIPVPETELFEKTFKAISAATEAPVHTLISVTISANETIIYWDHHEDGFEDPLSIEMQTTTEVWGDRNASNGCRPGSATCTDEKDVLFAGQAIVIDVTMTVPRGDNAIVVYDGGDNVKATYPIAVTRGAYPEKPGSLMAGAVEVHDTSYGWGRTFLAPLGTDTVMATNPFEYAAFYCQAKQDNTTIRVNGADLLTLAKGETYVYENLKAGDNITSSEAIQVHLLTGDKGSMYELRWYSILPLGLYSRSFVAPVGNSKSGVVLVMFNPNDKPIDVVYQWLESGAVQATSLSIPPMSNNISTVIPTGSGAFIDSSDDMIVMAVVDVTDQGHLYDWGFPAMPRMSLTPQVLIGLGYGCTGNVCDDAGVRSVVWVTSVADADLYIDFDNDGTVDETRSIKALEAVLVFDANDTDMSGAYLFASEPGSGPTGTPVDIAAAWGQNPDFSFSGDSYALDLGTVVVPFPSMKVSKHVELVIDENKDGLFNPGETVRYSIRVLNQSPRSFHTAAFTIVDPVLDQMDYVTDSTVYSCGINGTSIPISDDIYGTPFPLDGAGLNSRCILGEKGGEHTISFLAKIHGISQITKDMLKNCAILKSSLGPDVMFEVEVPLIKPDVCVCSSYY